jgi:hypothetical protein
MKKENLQNLKKYLEDTISAYFKISQDLQNLQFNDNNYLDYFENNITEEDFMEGKCLLGYEAHCIDSDILSIIDKLKENLNKINEELWAIHCKDLQVIMEGCF